MSYFITFEGIEGSGKSTQAARLADALKRAGHEVVTTREPGGTELGRKLRAILLEADAVAPTAETELFLYLADRAEHVSRLIRPALERGAVVICDRFSDSTLAYQAWGRGLDQEMVRSADLFARGGTAPGRTILLDLPVEDGLARARQTGPADRIEQETLAFHRRVQQGFHEIAAAESERVARFDARCDLATLAHQIAADVLEWIGKAR
ncbi:MAG: dTMP kinase [Deltaproteobacteria bacterium]